GLVPGLVLVPVPGRRPGTGRVGPVPGRRPGTGRGGPALDPAGLDPGSAGLAPGPAAPAGPDPRWPGFARHPAADLPPRSGLGSSRSDPRYPSARPRAG